MEKGVQIVSGKLGWCLKVDGYFINYNWLEVKAIEYTIDIPDGTSQWVSISALRNFWKEKKEEILESLNKPYVSWFGGLVLRTNFDKGQSSCN